MFDQQLKDICRKLKPLLGSRADALWAAYITAQTPDSKRQAESLIQMFALRHLSSTLADQAILLPPPPMSAAEGEFFLGTVFYGNRALFPLFLRRENFVKHVGIFSITGGGKTNVAQILALGLLDHDIPFLVVDWKRSYRALYTLPNPKVRRIRIYSVGRRTASSFRWNPLRPPPGVHPKTWISVVADALEKSHVSGPGVADIFIELLDKKFEQFGFYDSVPEKYPNFFDAAEELDRVQYKGRRMLWQDSCARILRTFTFGPAAGAFNARHPIRLEELLEQPVVIELDQEVPKPLRVFFTEILLRWIHLYRLGQGETDSLRHVTFLEESHNLFPRTLAERQSSNSLENVFREIRGFGEGLVTITQHPSLMPIYILGNCNTQVYLGLQHEDDILTARRALFLEHHEEVYLDRIGVGEGIVKIKGRVGPCLVKFPLVPIKKGAVEMILSVLAMGKLEERRMQKRVWIKSGVVEELDQRQVGLLELVYQKIAFYYEKLYRTRPCYQYPLGLSRLMKLCNHSSQAVTLALRYLANTVPEGSKPEPVIFYDRVGSVKNKSHRPYRIFLRGKMGTDEY